MTIKIKLTADAETGEGVDFNAELVSFFEDFTPYQMPVFLEEDGSDETTQILHLDTPTEGEEEDTRVVLLEGADFYYTFANHTVSGTIETIHIGTLGDAWDDSTSDLALEDGLVTDMSDIITISGLNIQNAAGVAGDVHEIVAGMMGGGIDGTEADPEPIYDVIWSEAHNVTGSTGDDTYSGTRFGDVVHGKGGDDTLSGNGGNDRLYGDAGNDRLYGGGGADKLYGNAGKDRLFGNAGNDTLNGGGGNDRLAGGNGNDRLLGGNGRDILNGGAGDDRLNGGQGADTLTGGKGADTFIFSSAAQADGDTITDFRSKQGDIIDLSAIDANEAKGGDQAFRLIGDDDFSGSVRELRVWSDAGQTFVAGDTDGDGTADFTITLEGTLTLGADDFLL